MRRIHIKGLLFGIVAMSLFDMNDAKAQVSVKSVSPSISRPDKKETGIVSFNDSNILLDNHTIQKRDSLITSVLEINGKAQLGGIVQIFLWNSTVRLKEIGFLIGFEETTFTRNQKFVLEIHQLKSKTDHRSDKIVLTYPLMITSESVKKGNYLSFNFDKSIELVKGAIYAVHFYPEVNENQVIKFQLAADNLLGFSFQAPVSRMVSFSNKDQNPDLNIYLLAEEIK